MRAPRCHGEEMILFDMHDDELNHTRTVWLCRKCDRKREIYPAPQRWLWIKVRCTDLEDEFMKPAWWLGAIGSMRFSYTGEVTFTVMPLNVLVDWCVRLYRWARYRKPDARTAELEASYRRGLVDGERHQRVKMTARIGQRFSEDTEMFEAGGPIAIGSLVVVGSDGKVRQAGKDGPRQAMMMDTFRESD